MAFLFRQHWIFHEVILFVTGYRIVKITGDGPDKYIWSDHYPL